MEFDRIYAEVDLGRIEENMKAMKEHLRPGTKMYGVVKTDELRMHTDMGQFRWRGPSTVLSVGTRWQRWMRGLSSGDMGSKKRS